MIKIFISNNLKGLKNHFPERIKYAQKYISKYIKKGIRVIYIGYKLQRQCLTGLYVYRQPNEMLLYWLIIRESYLTCIIHKYKKEPKPENVN
ncbi:MAG: hypothetical protein B6D61_07975 [Bacteroidetes bacterium 4484_249]|nr:MAG: hypothetical protein B6D61_07975 [Bacteroidetes bacterium 4484_249]